MFRDRAPCASRMFSGLLFIVWAATTFRSYACECVCYYSKECATGEYCSYKGCNHVHVDGKLKDGLCKKRSASLIPNEIPLVARGLELWRLRDSFPRPGRLVPVCAWLLPDSVPAGAKGSTVRFNAEISVR